MTNVRKTDGKNQIFIVCLYLTMFFRAGLQANVDVSIYAKTSFCWRQVEQIRLGLENNLDVSIYAKKEFDWVQMKEIRLGLEDDLDVFLYTKTEYTRKEMMNIRLGLKKILEKKLNLNLLKNQKLTAEEMLSILNLLKAGWNIFSTEENNKTIFI